ncbi:MAG: nucleotidyltransferase family protein [Ahrensia sp.]|nr:nucleotidyltransferase family protein [Ahrensia sp.]
MADISKAMVLAAGFGKRLRPITDTTPKPLVPVNGRSMLDRTFDTLIKSGIYSAVVNMHYLGEQIAAHCRKRTDITISISDERDAILETGGGTVKALDMLGDDPFVVVNADTFWIDFEKPNLTRLIEAFDANKMSILLLVCRMTDTTGHSGGIDFVMETDGRLSRAARDAETNNSHGYIYAGAAVYDPSVFAGAPQGSHSLNIYFDKAIAAGRLFGVVLEDGHWFTVGTPQGLEAVEEKLKALHAY